MNNKIENTQNILDEVHGLVLIPQYIMDLIDTKEFQRLRRIKQLGGAAFVYIGANHNRFQHSLGVFAIMSQIKYLNQTHNFSEQKWKEIFIAALLHDVGHGPLSHSIELISHNNAIQHEKIGQKIILNPKSEINKVLLKHNINPHHIIKLFNKKEEPLISNLLSSQIDADRMDYLLRDAHNTGTKYGTYDKNRIISSMILNQKKLVFKSSGIPSIEAFLLARYQSFKSIYLHRVSIIYQEMHYLLFKRLKDLETNQKYHSFIKVLAPILSGSVDLEKYHNLDDESLNIIIKQLAETDDKIISNLANAIHNRLFFKGWNYSEKLKERILEKLKEKKLDAKYYFVEVKIEKDLYNFNHEPIMIMSKDKNKNELFEISQKSGLIKRIKDIRFKKHILIAPKGILE